MPVGSASLPLVLRPKAGVGPPAVDVRNLALFVKGLLIAAVLISLGVFSVHTENAIGILAGMAFIVCYLLLRALYFRTSRLVADEMAVTYTFLPGFWWRIPRHVIGGIVLRATNRSVFWPRAFARWPVSKRVILIDQVGRCVLRMHADHYEYVDAFRLAAALDVPIDDAWEDGVSGPTLRKEIPGSISWVEAHGTAVSWAATLLAIAVLFTVAIVIASPKATG